MLNLFSLNKITFVISPANLLHGNSIDDKKLTYANCWSGLAKNKKARERMCQTFCVVWNLVVWINFGHTYVEALYLLLQQQTFSGWSKRNQTNFYLCANNGLSTGRMMRVSNSQYQNKICHFICFIFFFFYVKLTRHDNTTNSDFMSKTEKKQQKKKKKSHTFRPFGLCASNQLPMETAEHW